MTEARFSQMITIILLLSVCLGSLTFLPPSVEASAPMIQEANDCTFSNTELATITVAVQDTGGGVRKVTIEISGPDHEGNYTMQQQDQEHYFYSYTFPVAGEYTCVISAKDNTEKWSSATLTLTITDGGGGGGDGHSVGPNIQDVNDCTFSNTEEATITVAVMDNGNGVNKVTIKISGPDPAHEGNFTMTQEHPPHYTYTDTFPMPGEYTCVISAKDNEGHWSNATLKLTITDGGGGGGGDTPQISDMRADPPVQSCGGYVNISLLVDWDKPVKVTFMTDGVEDEVMQKDDTTGRHFFNRTYSNYGTVMYRVTVWKLGNPLAAANGEFEMIDDVPPTAHIFQPHTEEGETGVYVYTGDDVKFMDGSSDNRAVTNSTWTFTYDGKPVILYGIDTKFTFNIPGSYLVTLTAKDNDDNSDKDTVWVNVSEYDQDDDGVPSWDEVLDHGTDPDVPDTDGDGLDDGWELNHTLNPLDPADAAYDPDDDGLNNLQEFENGTDMAYGDTDKDGLGDGVELIFFGTDPTAWDSDEDGVSDGLEEFGYAAQMEILPDDCIGMTIQWQGNFIQIKTNSSVLGATYDTDLRALTIKVGGPDGTSGHANITAPKTMIEGQESIFVQLDDVPIQYELIQNVTHYIINIAYHHSQHDLTTYFDGTDTGDDDTGDDDTGDDDTGDDDIGDDDTGDDDAGDDDTGDDAPGDDDTGDDDGGDDDTGDDDTVDDDDTGKESTILPRVDRVLSGGKGSATAQGMVIGGGTISVQEAATPGEEPDGSIGIYIDVSLDGPGEVEWVLISVTYSTVPEGVDESALRLYYWDDAALEWALAENSHVDVDSKTVWANVTHLTRFAPLARESTDDGEEGGSEAKSSGGTMVIVAVVIIVIVVVMVVFFMMRGKGKGDVGEVEGETPPEKEKKEGPSKTASRKKTKKKDSEDAP